MDRRANTACGRSGSRPGVGGSSLGGLVSLYLGLRYASILGKLAVLSPSVWWNHKSILGYLNERAPEIWDRPRIWLDVGDKEGQPHRWITPSSSTGG